MTALLVLLGGAVGAALRYVVDVELRRRRGAAWPWGTFTVNVAGSAVLGLLAAAGTHGLPGWLASLVGVGFCGALTTFSTFSADTLALLERDRLAAALGYVVGSLAAGLVAFSAVWWAVAA